MLPPADGHVARARASGGASSRLAWKLLGAGHVESRLKAAVAALLRAARPLRAAPVPTALAVTALALGVGANAALFGAVRGVLLTPLPYPEPERLVQVWTEHVVPCMAGTSQ